MEEERVKGGGDGDGGGGAAPAGGRAWARDERRKGDEQVGEREKARVRERENEWGERERETGTRSAICPTNHHKWGPQQPKGEAHEQAQVGPTTKRRWDLHKPQVGPTSITSGAQKTSNTRLQPRNSL